MTKLIQVNPVSWVNVEKILSVEKTDKGMAIIVSEIGPILTNLTEKALVKMIQNAGVPNFLAGETVN